MARKLAKKAVSKQAASPSRGSSKKKATKSSGTKKAKSGASSSTPRKKRTRKKATRVYSVTAVQREPEYVRSLVVIDADDPLWADCDDNDTPPIHAYPDIEGGIVWVIPPAETSDQAIDRMMRAVNNDKPHTVKLLPRESTKAVVPAQTHKDAEDAPRQTARELVMEMADEANSTNTKALKKLLNDVLGEEGL